MTTVVGIRIPEVNLALLVADRQTTSSRTPEKYIYGRKVQTSKDSMYAFGHSGTRAEDLYALTEKMINGQIDMQKVLKEGKFPELRELNMSRLGNKMPNLDTLSSFLVISRFDKNPQLHTCWPMGDVEPREVTWIGSGSKGVEDHYNAHMILTESRNYTGNQRPATSDSLIQFGLEAVRYAQGRDLYSSGFDLIAMTPEKTIDCVNDLQDDFGKKIKKVQAKVKL